MGPKGKGPKGRGPSAYRSPRAAGEAWSGKIERLTWGGLGLAHAADGRLILLRAPLALFPGEAVEADIHWKPRHGEGSVKAWTARDPRRVPAACPVAERCGGCDLWEAGPAASELKRAMVEDLFRRALPDAPEWTWLSAPAEARRHRIQMHWDGKKLGFHRRGSQQIVEVTGCPAAAEPLGAAIPRFQEALAAKLLPTRPQRWELSTGTPAAKVFATDEGGRSWVLEPDGFQRSDESAEQILGGLRLRHRAGGFFQACPAWAWEAFQGVLTGWNLKGGALFDLYGGVGLFSAMLKDRFQRFLLVESDEAAVGFAKKNLSALGLDFEALAGDVAAWAAERTAAGGAGLGRPGDLLLLDPPREGLAPELCESLQAAGAASLVLVGCDGAAFCRDAKRLGPAWRLERLAVLDLFPNTNHVECVGLFVRAAEAGR
jgi:23S rRNA (uracil1939-C5)-methyltransferase